MTSVEAFVAIYECGPNDRETLIEIANQFSLFDVSHLSNNQIRNVIALKLSPLVEGLV